MRRLSIPALFVCAILACDGEQGPVGPQGPPGPGTRITYSGLLDSEGTVTVTLPEEAGTESDPPVIACYVSETGDAWFALAFDSNGSEPTWLCGWGESGESLSVVIITDSSLSQWQYRIAVVY